MVAQFSGEKLRAIRKAQNMIIATLAERSGHNQKTVILIERGYCMPTVPVLCHFADVLGVSIAAFFIDDIGGAR